MSHNRPQIIKDVGFDFRWSEEKVWALDLPLEEMSIEDLLWHFDIPFWEKEGTDDWNLTPWEVIQNPEKEPSHYKRIKDADLSYPLDIMWNKGRWTLLDGLHRLTKAYIQGDKIVQVKKVPTECISLIKKDVDW